MTWAPGAAGRIALATVGMEDSAPAELVNPVVAAASAHNGSVVVKTKTTIGLLLGAVAGLFGLEGFVGIAFFVVGYTSAFLLISYHLGADKAKFGAENRALAVAGLGSSFAAFALAWVLLFNFI